VRLYFELVLVFGPPVLVLVLVLDGIVLATRLVTNEPVLSACVMSRVNSAAAARSSSAAVSSLTAAFPAAARLT